MDLSGTLKALAKTCFKAAPVTIGDMFVVPFAISYLSLASAAPLGANAVPEKSTVDNPLC